MEQFVFALALLFAGMILGTGLAAFEVYQARRYGQLPGSNEEILRELDRAEALSDKRTPEWPRVRRVEWAERERPVVSHRNGVEG